MLEQLYWLILFSILVGWFWYNKGRSPIGGFVVSFLLSPLVGFLVGLLLENKKGETNEEKV